MNHWLTFSIRCIEGEVMVYNSLYVGNKSLKNAISEVFKSSDIHVLCTYPRVQQQTGRTGCGLYAKAFATHLVYGTDLHDLPALQFQQTKLREHLVTCFEQKYMKEFPSVTVD